MSLALLFYYLMLNMFRMLVHPSSGACDLFVELLHGLYCSGSMCVGVTVWFGWGGVVPLCRLKHCYSASWVVLLCFDVCWCYGVVRLGWCVIRMLALACIRMPHHTPVCPTNAFPQSGHVNLYTPVRECMSEVQ